MFSRSHINGDIGYGKVFTRVVTRRTSLVVWPVHRGRSFDVFVVGVIPISAGGCSLGPSDHIDFKAIKKILSKASPAGLAFAVLADNKLSLRKFFTTTKVGNTYRGGRPTLEYPYAHVNR